MMLSKPFPHIILNVFNQSWQSFKFVLLEVPLYLSQLWFIHKSIRHMAWFKLIVKVNIVFRWDEIEQVLINLFIQWLSFQQLNEGLLWLCWPDHQAAKIMEVLVWNFLKKVIDLFEHFRKIQVVYGYIWFEPNEVSFIEGLCSLEIALSVNVLAENNFEMVLYCLQKESYVDVCEGIFPNGWAIVSWAVVVQATPNSERSFSVSEDSIQEGNSSPHLPFRLLFFCVHALYLVENAVLQVESKEGFQWPCCKFCFYLHL